MDQFQQNSVQILGQFTQFQFPKKPIQILLSISAFSILFSLSPFFPLFSSCISTFSSQIFTYTTDRKYVFLFCNGLLAFLIRNSSGDADQDRQMSVPEKTELVREEVVELKQENGKGSEEEEEEEVKEIVFYEEEKEAEEEEEEGVGLMSAEELNKKCEEFIRKMREGIKIEARN